MEGYEHELHIGDDLFTGMREDADMVLQKLLKNMVEKDSLEGKVTIGIDVTLVQEFIPNFDPNTEGETRRVLTPKFSHKVGSVMQIKNEAKGGRNCDGTELVWDDERGEYVLRPIANTDQMTIFDADFKCVNDPEENGWDADKEQPVLAGKHVAALPGSIEGDMQEDNTEDMSEEFGDDAPFTFGEDNADDGYGYEEPEEF